MNFKNWLTKADMIKAECQQFLSETSLPLYRGADVAMLDMFKASVSTVRKDRRPLHSKPIVHKMVDDWFEKRYNIRPRSEGLFCTGDKRIADMYGQPVYVFPVGNFSYMWSVSARKHLPIDDSHVYMNWLRGEIDEFTSQKEAEERLDKVLSNYHFLINDSLQSAQEASAEIIIMCNKVILVPIDRIRDYPSFIKSLK